MDDKDLGISDDFEIHARSSDSSMDDKDIVAAIPMAAPFMFRFLYGR